MRKITVLIAALALAGCSDKPLTNDEVIAAVKKCRAADLVAVQFYTWTFRTTEIQCQQHVRS